MRRIRYINPLLRATGVIGAVAVAVTGITYAALNSQVSLTGTSIDSAIAGLAIWDGSTFATTAAGFNITNLVPGTGVTENVYLQNTGSIPLAVTAHIPTLPTATGFSGWNNALVSITAENTSCTPPTGFVPNTVTAGTSNTSDNTVDTNLADLNSGQVILPCEMNVGDTGNSSVAGTAGNYDFRFDIAPSSITGSSATISAFNFNFTGAGTTTTP